MTLSVTTLDQARYRDVTTLHDAVMAGTVMMGLSLLMRLNLRSFGVNGVAIETENEFFDLAVPTDACEICIARTSGCFNASCMGLVRRLEVVSVVKMMRHLHNYLNSFMVHAHVCKQ